MQSHEYSISGHSRTSTGRWLGIISAFLAASLVAASATLVKALAFFGGPPWVQTIATFTVSGGVVYFALHWWFNRYGWRILSLFAQVPHIAGTWRCNGQTLGPEGGNQYQWDATITISQDWEKIRVRTETQNSSSYSVSAALIPEPDGCWILMYSYRNEPRIGEPELKAHVGYCELRFTKEQDRAEGDYFNAKGRGTFGRMTITRTQN